MTKHITIKDNRALIVSLHDGRGWVYEQPINAKTGKPWQAKRNMEIFDNEAKAMWAWCKRGSK